MRFRKITLVTALLLLAGMGLISPAQADETPNGPVFTAMNTSETLPDGIWFRNSPHTGDTDRVTGHGPYMGERLQLRCYAWGDSVGPYNDTLWYKALDVSRPTNAGVENSGFINAHYVDDGQNANVVDAGVPDCTTSSGGMPEPAPSAISVYYSPNDTPNSLTGLQVADLNRPLGDWAQGNCSSVAGPTIVPGGVKTVAGWSKGRLGPIYFLSASSAEVVSQVHTIILFDPGSTVDFAKVSRAKLLLGVPQTCDWQYPVGTLLANWVAADPQNHLYFFTGKDSEEKKNKKATYAGLWKYYLAQLWNQTFATRALVCDYDGMDHETVLRSFANKVQDPPSGKCPTAAGYTLTQWHP